MLELTVRICFSKHCLGNTKAKDGSGRLLLPRNPAGQVIFMATWHQANLLFAAKVFNRHQEEVRKILWDIAVDGIVRPNWYKRYCAEGKKKYVQHECFYPGQTVGLNCVVPASISQDDFWQLMQIAGTYRGLSPYHPTKYGFFDVKNINPRRKPVVTEEKSIKVFEKQTGPEPLPKAQVQI